MNRRGFLGILLAAGATALIPFKAITAAPAKKVNRVVPQDVKALAGSTQCFTSSTILDHAASEGELYFNTDNARLFCFDGTQWIPIPKKATNGVISGLSN